MTQALLPLPNSPQTPRRGRPPGSRNRRGGDLAAYVAATFEGTPGQQMAQLALVTPKQRKRARAEAAALQILNADQLDDQTLAHVVASVHLARALGCERKEAWLLRMKEREALMAYVHQKLAPKEPPKPADALPTVFLVPDGPDQGQLPDMTGDDADSIEILGEIPAPQT